jgi:hypothetical protein
MTNKAFKSKPGGPVPAGRTEQWKPSDAVKAVFHAANEATLRAGGVK